MPNSEAKSPRFNPPESVPVKAMSCRPDAGAAEPGSFATRPCTGLKSCSTKPSAFPSRGSGSASTASSASSRAWETSLAGLLSLIIPIAAWIRGVPYVTLMRMAVNLGIGVLVGSIPILGDAFDIGWKANRRNYLLLQRHLGEPRRHTWKDWAFLIVLACVMGLIFAIPIVLVIWLLAWLIQH